MTSGASWFSYNGQQRRSAFRGLEHGRLFRSADLNAVGWLAVFGPGVVAGLVVALASGLPLLLCVGVGALCSLFVAVVLDRLAWRRITTGLGTELPRPRAEAVVGRLRAQGVEVVLEEHSHADGEVSLSFQSTNRFLSDIHREVQAEQLGSDER